MAPAGLQCGQGGTTGVISVTWINYFFSFSFFFNYCHIQVYDGATCSWKPCKQQQDCLSTQSCYSRWFREDLLWWVPWDFSFFHVGDQHFELIWFWKFLLYIIYVIKLRRLAQQSLWVSWFLTRASTWKSLRWWLKRNHQGQLAAKEIQATKTNGVLNGQRSSRQRWKKRCCRMASWIKKPVEKDSSTITKGTMTKADEKKLRHGWLNKFAVASISSSPSLVLIFTFLWQGSHGCIAANMHGF